MTFRIGIGKIWREFPNVEDAVDFAFGRCLYCRAKSTGRFCRKHYRALSAEAKRYLIERSDGRLIGYEPE